MIRDIDRTYRANYVSVVTNKSVYQPKVYSSNLS